MKEGILADQTEFATQPLKNHLKGSFVPLTLRYDEA